MTTPRLAAILIALFYLACCLYVGQRFITGNPVDTNILSLLPADARDPVVNDAMRRAGNAASTQLVFAIEGGTPQARQTAADALTANLATTGLFRASADDGQEMWRFLFARRAALLCPADRVALAAGNGHALEADALRQWYGGLAAPNSQLLATDPLLLTNRLLQCLVLPALPATPSGDVTLVTGHLTASPFELNTQNRIGKAVIAWQTAFASPGLRVSRAGAVFNAAYGADQARQNISYIGTITTIALLLIYFVMFRSLRPALIAITMVICGLAAGTAVTLLCFGTIHIMALLFGAALIGMVVDYTTYFLVTGIGAPNTPAAARRKHIFRPLTLGMSTSVGAFAVLLLFPVPAFRQIAVLGGSGLLAAWLGAMWLLPFLEGKPAPAGPAACAVERAAIALLASAPKSRLMSPPVLAGAAILVLATALCLGHARDDVRLFQAPSPSITAEADHISQLTGFAPTSRFILVRGSSADDEARNEQALRQNLGPAATNLLAASAFVPATATTARDAALIHTALLTPQLAPLLAQLNLSASNAYASVTPGSALPAPLTWLRGQTGATYWSIIPLPDSIAAQIPTGGPNWQVVDPAARYSALIAHYRVLATYGLIGAVLSTSVILLAVYRRARALIIMLPTTLGLVTALALPPLLGLPFSFFSVMGAFVVAGAGVDYAIFQWEHPGKRGDWTRVGILLAASMTCISIGLLALSSVFPVRSFGVTVALGIALSLILSSLVHSKND